MPTSQAAPPVPGFGRSPAGHPSLCSRVRAELPPSEASAGVATGVREADKTCQLTFIGGLPSAASGGVVC